MAFRFTAIGLLSLTLAGTAGATAFQGHTRFPLDPSSLPQIGRLVFQVGNPGQRANSASCTGALIGVRHVLTAAHCVFFTLQYNSRLATYNASVRTYNERVDSYNEQVRSQNQRLANSGSSRRYSLAQHRAEAQPRTIYFQPGLFEDALPAGGKNVAADMSQTWMGEFAGETGSNARTREEAIRELVAETPTDYAIITLSENPSNTQFSNMGSLSVSHDALTVGTSLIAIGYSSDYRQARTPGVDSHCHVRRVYENGTFFHDCAIEQGASGGPMLSTKVDGTLVTSANESQLSTYLTSHPNARVEYQIVGVITSEVRPRQGGGYFRPTPWGYSFEPSHNHDSNTYSDSNPNISNGASNVLTDLAEALAAEGTAGLTGNGPAPQITTIRSASPQSLAAEDDDDEEESQGPIWIVVR